MKKQAPARLVTVFNPVYKNYAYVLAGWAPEKAEKWLNSGRDGDFLRISGGADGYFFKLGGKFGSAIWLRNWCGGCAYCLSALAHETLHLCTRVLFDRGVGIELPEAEVLTYLHEFYMCEFLKKLKLGKTCS